MHRQILAVVLVVLGLTATTAATASTAGAASKPKNPNGHYVGTEAPAQALAFDAIAFNFDVKTKGKQRKITGFTIAMNVVCSGFPLYTEYVVQPMNTMKVNARSGRFKDVVTGATDGGTTFRVEVAGRLKGTTVRDGTMSYDVGLCQRGSADDPVAWKASRKGKG